MSMNFDESERDWGIGGREEQISTNLLLTVLRIIHTLP